MIHITFCVTWVLFIVVVNLSQFPSPQFPPPPIAPYILAFVSILGIAAGVVIRMKLLAPAAESLRTNDSDPVTWQRWFNGNVFSFAGAEMVSLCGIMARFLGFPWSIAGVFFAIGLVVLLLWRPKLDLPALA